MSTFTISAFFTNARAQLDETPAKIGVNLAAFLTVLCWAFVALFIISRFTPTLSKKFEESIGENVFFLVWLIPAVATFLSLFFSEFLGWTPCRLCWYQRIFMYSLAVLMLVYWFKRSAIIRRIGYMLVVIGAPISFYHIGMERFWFEESTSCSPTVSCAAPWFKTLGPAEVTTAGMALTAFVTIGVLLYMTSKYDKKIQEND